MAIIKSFSPFQNLSNFNVFLEDNDPNSEYFRITEFQETFTGGKNGFLIEGSEFLKPSTEVKLELLDVEGNPIFFIPGDGIPEYYEGVSKLVSVHVYEDTPIGQGKITILGELERYIDDQGIEREVPDEWKGVYNVKWERTFRVNKNLNNETIVRFVNRPQVQIDEIVKPFFIKDIPQITQTGNASGLGENPVEGTNLDGYTAGTLYRLAITDDSNFTASVDENVITFPDLGYSSTVREVLNNKEVLVDVPYTENNIVTNFQNQSYTTTFEDLESQSTVESALTGSFAKIKLNRLKTFVGDVARVKVFRKSRNEVGDFQLVQDARIESTELLRDVTVQDDTEVFYGNFTQNILDIYWVSGSNDHPVSLDDTKLFGGIQVDYNEGIGGTQTLITSESFQIEDDVEYTVSFKTIFDGTPTTDKFVRVSLSGSNYEQVISTTIPSASFNTRQNIKQNFIATTSSLDTKLQFEFVGADWYVSRVSLKNAQETSFSPDELTLIQDVPRRLPQETFDFRFEFYDVNNNFIPVSVTSTKEFVGGNDFRTEQKLFTFESDRTAFRFITGSLGNPSFQQIRFSNTIQNLTGSVLYTSQAFDIDGNLITSESYHDSGVLEYPGGFSGSYPGLLLNSGNDGATLPISNFSGSVSGVTVGSIIYTASLESRQEFETIFRFEDGEDAPALIVTSNTNQFIYEPTQLRPKPLGQEVRIKAQRKNLASLITPITVNSGSGNPPLTEGVDVNGIKNYSISANTFSASFAGSNGAFPEVTYEFTSSDEFNNEFTDEITVSPVINFDGLSVVLSNESTTFRANSQGLVLDDFASGDGEVEVRIGENVIEHSDGLTTRNRFDIISATETNVTAKDTTPSTNEYGIIQLNGDSGSLVLDIKYLAGDNATSQSFTKKVNYTKSRISPPAITISTSNKSQNVTANSTGVQTEDFDDAIISVQEIYTGSVTTFGSGDISINIDSDPQGIVTYNNDLSFTFDDLSSGVNSTRILFTATVTDSEGQNRQVSDTISLSKSPKGAPALEFQVTPNAQTVESDSTGGNIGTPDNLVVTVREGTTSRTLTSLSSTATNGVTISSADPSTGIITPNVSGMAADTSTITINAETEDSEGSDISTTLTARITRAKKAPPNVLVTATPQSQTVAANSSGTQTGTLSNVSVSALEGNTSVFDSMSIVSTSGFSATPEVNGNTLNMSSATMNSSEASVTLEVNFTNSEGQSNSQNITINSTLSIRGSDGGPGPVGPSGSAGEPGATGPGVVHTGLWEAGRVYQFDDGLLTGTGRRDTVLLNGTYYATTRTHTSTNDSNSNTGRPDLGGPWVSLGTEDFFVAAKISIFEDSFVQNTLNIGSNNNGQFSVANITLAGGTTNPYFSLGQNPAGTYGANGIFIGNDGGNFRASFVNGTTSFLKWTGSSLEIKGSITITGGSGISNLTDAGDLATRDNIPLSLVTDAGAMAAINQINSGNATTYIGNGAIVTSLLATNAITSTNFTYSSGNFSTAGTFLDLSDGSITSQKFAIDNSGNAFFKGDVTGASGNFSGKITAGSMILGNDAGGNGVNGIYIDPNDYWYDNGNFSLGNGNLTWNGATLLISSGASFGGQLTSPSGTIGGWTINSSYLAKDTGTNSTSAGLSPTDYPFYAGSTYANRASAPFRVTPSGDLTATSANITGLITANSGTFNGTVNASGGNFTGFVNAGGMKFGVDVAGGNDGIYIDGNDYWYDNGNFSLGNGNLTWNGSDLDITTSNFNLSSGRLSIDSNGTTFPAAQQESGGGNTFPSINFTGTSTEIDSQAGTAGQYLKWKFNYDTQFSPPFNAGIVIEVQGQRIDNNTWESTTDVDIDIQHVILNNTAGTMTATQLSDATSTKIGISGSGTNNYEGTLALYAYVTSTATYDNFRIKLTDTSSASQTLVNFRRFANYYNVVEMNSTGFYVRYTDTLINRNGIIFQNKSLLVT